ncbi:MAG: site-2 protease family protein [Longimicrobiaceae bacterium]
METEQLLIALPVLIFSVVVHEYAHGWMAREQGDHTAEALGRLTLNPLPHLDPVGSFLVPALFLLLPGGVILGWAKPVPVVPRNYRNYKKGDILVSVAGVAANLVLALVSAALLALVVVLFRLVPAAEQSWQVLAGMAEFGIFINLILIVFNLLPIPPLDGSHLFYHLLPARWGLRYRELAPFGMFALIALLFIPGAIGWILSPALVATLWLRGAALSVASLFA